MDDLHDENEQNDLDISVLDQVSHEEVADDSEVASGVESEDVEKRENGKKVDLYIKNVVETLLFVNEKPITIEQLKKAIDTATPAEIKRAVNELMDEYDKRDGGMTVVELAGGYQMRTNPHYASYVRDFYKTKHKEKLSKPALEALAIIAYKQPVTRADIELIRGVNSDGVVVHLINKELLKVVGRKDVPGRPFTYGTTKQFLEYFGLKSLDNLPRLEEFPSLLPKEDEIDEEITFVQEKVSYVDDDGDIDIKEHIQQEQISAIDEIELEAANELNEQSVENEKE